MCRYIFMAAWPPVAPNCHPKNPKCSASTTAPATANLPMYVLRPEAKLSWDKFSCSHVRYVCTAQRSHADTHNYTHAGLQRIGGLRLLLQQIRAAARQG